MRPFLYQWATSSHVCTRYVCLDVAKRRLLRHLNAVFHSYASAHPGSPGAKRPPHRPHQSILNAATIQAIHCTISKRLRNALRKLSDVGMVKEVRESQISVDDIRIK